jgi:hypothetical protein
VSTHPDVELFIIRPHFEHVSPRKNRGHVYIPQLWAGKFLSLIESLQCTREMKRKIFATFSHTLKRLPNPIPLLVPTSERSYLPQLESKKSENISESCEDKNVLKSSCRE